MKMSIIDEIRAIKAGYRKENIIQRIYSNSSY